MVGYGGIWWDMVGYGGIGWNRVGYGGVWWDQVGYGGVWWDLKVLTHYPTDRYSRPALLCVIFIVRAFSYLLVSATSSSASLFLFSMLFGLVDYSVVPPTVSLVRTHLGDAAVKWCRSKVVS
jgi:hypothetical protein